MHERQLGGDPELLQEGCCTVGDRYRLESQPASPNQNQS